MYTINGCQLRHYLILKFDLESHIIILSGGNAATCQAVSLFVFLKQINCLFVRLYVKHKHVLRNRLKPYKKAIICKLYTQPCDTVVLRKLLLFLADMLNSRQEQFY